MIQSLAHSALKSYIRYFPVSKGKVRLLTRLWRYATPHPYVRTVTIDGTTVQMTCDLSKFVQRHIYFFGSFEAEDCARWMRIARNAPTIFDVGANAGLYSLLAAYVNPTATIYAFEPTNGMWNDLLANLELNHATSVHPQKVAVGAADTIGYVHISRGNSGDNEGTNYVTTAVSAQDEEQVKVVSLDSFCQQAGIDTIDLLKMDIEGGEYHALQGAQNLLSRHAIRCVFIELVESVAQRQGYTTADVKRLLVNHGYSIYRMGTDKTPVRVEETHKGENVIALAPGVEWL